MTMLRLPQLTLAFVAAGAVVRLTAGTQEAATVWMFGLLVTGAPVVWRTVRRALNGDLATDLVALLAVVTSILLAQPLAGLVIVLMQTGGEALEAYAEGRASSAVRALEADAPRRAHRMPTAAADATTAVEDIDVSAIAVGDLLLVRPGEMVPSDGVVLKGASHVDSSRLTGEPIPARASVGAVLPSGSVNLEGPLVIRATATAGESQYARIVELVRTAQRGKAPLQRLADRYAVWFTPLTLAACGAAYLASGDLQRVLAVLVVATPCPLILAAPVAIIGGINRAARRLIVVRNGGVLEQLAAVTTAVFDKTGTLTIGTPTVSQLAPAEGFTEQELLGLAAAVEAGSGHLLARSVMAEARARGLSIPGAREVVESAGRGARGLVDGRRICVGARSYVIECVAALEATMPRLDAESAGLRAHVAVDDRWAGTIEFADQLRPGLPRLFADLRRLGIHRCLLLSGDSAAHTSAVAATAGIAEARGELLPGDKASIVRDLERAGQRVLMVGDGTNDAPALSTASVGVALAGHGGGITAEAAGVVILTDDLSRVVEAIQIGRRTMRVARQSIAVGLALSLIAMAAAAAGYVPVLVGALLQEAIDVAVILNALRTSRDTSETRAWSSLTSWLRLRAGRAGSLAGTPRSAASQPR